MSPAFFPFPYPVSTPIGQGYAIYVTPAPMFENDSWCVQLDDGRILHFSTNQLRGVSNGTYEIRPESDAKPHDAPPPRPPPDVHHTEVDGASSLCGREGPRAGVMGPKATCPACLTLAHEYRPLERPTAPSTVASASRRMAERRR